MTGFYRDGRCNNTGREDIGSHTACVMTAAFLDFSKSRGTVKLRHYPAASSRASDTWDVVRPRGEAAQVCLAEDNKMINTLAPDRSD